uniref:NADH-ubiquinone oxidoreductase chain 4 n=1 Tax=Ricinoides karschii TaxID=1238228 RepID=W5R4L4_9ARAC|nr:NADH dehydrogenase subunit 4 [Ricinoides karschii]AGL11953.1 NADH dehydrogenase subunit 4 [Ricinoides karschii]
MCLIFFSGGLLVVTYWLKIGYIVAMLSFMLLVSMTKLVGCGWSDLSWLFGGDVMSWAMVIMSVWIVMMMFMSQSRWFGFYGFNNFVFVSLLFFLVLSFSFVNLFSFYVSFESVLIPTLILICGWGFQPERLYAGMYMLFYTLMASLPLFMCLLKMYSDWGSLSFFVLVDFNVVNWMVVGMMVAFLVKHPMYFFHLWLPRAHVEAPVSGSMILAGVLLKLGGYGLFRVVVLFKDWLVMESGYLMSIGLVGGVITGFVCVGQVDMKMLVAYSSVVHMSLVLGGVVSGLKIGFYGSLAMMIAHGLCSSCLFYLVNVFYERLHSRSLMMVKGMLMLSPIMSMWWFMMCVCNMSAPPSMSLLAELMLMISLVKFDVVISILLFVLNFLCAVFSLCLYNAVQHGKSWFNWFGYDVVIREYLVLFLHWVPLNVMFIGYGVWVE